MDVSQYLEIFVEETREHLQNLNEHILVLEKEPDKKQLYFCLGLINYQMKLDLQSAEKYFTNFLITCADNEKYQKQLFEAKNILANIQTFVTEICE